VPTVGRVGLDEFNYLVIISENYVTVYYARRRTFHAVDETALCSHDKKVVVLSFPGTERSKCCNQIASDASKIFVCP
jgi:hypothetical protein